MTTRKTPQEKKRLSYVKDRRPNYGNNEKAARKSVPRNKRHPNRANRHRAHQVLLGAKGRPDPETGGAVEAGGEERGRVGRPHGRR